MVGGKNGLLADRTLALARKFGELDADEQMESPLRFLDATSQVRKGGSRKESVELKTAEVAQSADLVAKAKGEGRFIKFIVYYGTRRGVVLSGVQVGNWLQAIADDELRKCSVGDVLAFSEVPPFMTADEFDVFREVLKDFDVSKPLFALVSDFGSARVDKFLALDKDIAVAAAAKACFASLGPLVDHMWPLHDKKQQVTVGPGAGACADLELSSGVDELGVRSKTQISSITRGDKALPHLGAHGWTPAGVPPELLADVNDGLLLQLAPQLRGGKLELALIQVGDTYGERWRANVSTIRYAPIAAASGAKFGVAGVEARECEAWEREACAGCPLSACVLAGTLNLGDLARVSRPVSRFVADRLCADWVRDQYAQTHQNERAQHGAIGPVVEFATGCPWVPSDGRFENSVRGEAYDARTLPRLDAVLAYMKGNSVRAELKDRSWFCQKKAGPTHGKRKVPGDPRFCEIMLGFDLGSSHSSKVSERCFPFSTLNLAATLAELELAHTAMASAADREPAFFDVIKASKNLKRIRGYIVAIRDADDQKHRRRFDFSKDAAEVKADVFAALKYALARALKWRAATPSASELADKGPRIVPDGYWDFAIPESVAADVRAPAAPAHPSPSWNVYPSGQRVPLRLVRGPAAPDAVSVARAAWGDDLATPVGGLKLWMTTPPTVQRQSTTRNIHPSGLRVPLRRVGDVLVGAGDVLVEDEEDEETSDTRVLKCWTTTTTEPTLRAAEPRPPPWSESVEYQRKRSADEAFAADAQEGFDDAVAVAAARGSKIEELLQELRKAAADPRDFLQPAHTLCGDYLAGAGAPDHSAPFDFQPSSAVDFAAIAADALAMCDAAERKADKTVRDMTSDAFKTALKKAKIDYKGKKHEDLHVALVNYYALHQKYDPAELFPKPS